MPGTTTSPRDPRPERRHPRTGIDGGRTRFSRYDLLLAVIPAAFLSGLLVSGAAGVPLRLAMPAAAGVGALALVDGLFLNPPRRPRAGNGSP